MARRAQRTGRAHLRVPVDEMIFATFYRQWAKRPAGQISVREAFFVSFCALQKVTRRARDWLRNAAMDGLPKRQTRSASQNCQATTAKNKKKLKEQIPQFMAGLLSPHKSLPN